MIRTVEWRDFLWLVGLPYSKQSENDGSTKTLIATPCNRARRGERSSEDYFASLDPVLQGSFIFLFLCFLRKRSSLEKLHSTKLFNLFHKPYSLSRDILFGTPSLKSEFNCQGVCVSITWKGSPDTRGSRPFVISRTFFRKVRAQGNVRNDSSLPGWSKYGGRSGERDQELLNVDLKSSTLYGLLLKKSTPFETKKTQLRMRQFLQSLINRTLLWTFYPHR